MAHQELTMGRLYMTDRKQANSHDLLIYSKSYPPRVENHMMKVSPMREVWVSPMATRPHILAICSQHLTLGRLPFLRSSVLRSSQAPSHGTWWGRVIFRAYKEGGSRGVKVYTAGARLRTIYGEERRS